LLAPQGIRTVRVRTGREALDRIEREKIDVAILDQNMPQLPASRSSS
jgi:CheY-like chemotaxis protein